LPPYGQRYEISGFLITRSRDLSLAGKAFPVCFNPRSWEGATKIFLQILSDLSRFVSDKKHLANWMNILIDTCDALWFWSGDQQLSARKRAHIEDARNTIFFSSVSAAEIAIKYSIRKLVLPEIPQIYIPKLRQKHQFAELPFYENAALLLDSLPLIHRDPFDRELICQALAHNLHLLSSDPKIHQYSGIQLL
jgi:PIN domain nuclease of toxin-antitoxin system